MNKKISNLRQIASVTRYQIIDGNGEGLKVLDVNNGVLRFLLNETKALDIMQLFHQGTNISFVSKNGFQSGNNEFSKRFEGGMLYTCGLDSAGGRAGYETHGSFHNLKAQICKVLCDDDEICIEGTIEDTALFGKHLLLKRCIKTKVNADYLEVEDELINLGHKDEEFCLLYHINLGYPMIDEGVKIFDDPEVVIPRTEYAKVRFNDRNICSDSVDNEEERCYFIEHNVPQVKVKNEKLCKEFTLQYSKDSLPKFVEWQSMSSSDYALGLEPTTTFLDDYFAYKTIKKGEHLTFKIRIQVSELSK